MKKRLTTFKELKERKTLFNITLIHIKLFFKELIMGKHIHQITTGGTFTHLTLAKDNFYQWIFPQY